MNLDDLRYSNSLYVLRAISEKAKTVEEIAKETQMTVLTVNKILQPMLCDNIVAKYKNEEIKRCGRPNVYYGLCSFYFSALLLSHEGKLHIYYFSPTGKITLYGEPIKFVDGDETLLASFVRGHIGQHNPKCLGVYLMGDDLHKFNGVKFVTKLDVNELFINAFSDDENTVFIEHDYAKILINHSKAKIIDVDKEELEKILDIEIHHNFKGRTKKDLILIGMKKLTKKLLESKI